MELLGVSFRIAHPFQAKPQLQKRSIFDIESKPEAENTSFRASNATFSIKNLVVSVFIPTFAKLKFKQITIRIIPL